MKRINNSNFELLQDIFKDIEFNYVEKNVQNLENMVLFWIDIVGEKISKFSKVLEFSDDDILTIACSDSFVANELFLEKDKLLSKMNEKSAKMGIKIKDMKFNYKKWKNEYDV
ncbi:MAG: DUF721 domain-containing protein [Cyanobacteria bacterium SIG29]|nr:DUF721 domain-containing protein [Cyanobacteria bacterium SIG29]